MKQQSMADGTRERVGDTVAVSELGYLGFEVRDLSAWERFATEVLGLGLGPRLPDGGFALRMDRRPARMLVTPGPGDDLSVVGWLVRSEDELLAAADRVAAAGARVKRGTDAEAEARLVKQFVRFEDPAGIPTEIALPFASSPEPFRSPLVKSGFIADDLGMGHAVLTTRTQAESLEFYERAMGFRLSDRIVCDLQGHQVNIAFMHVNRRHHSVAFGGPQRKRLHHFMLEARDLEDVGLCYDRAVLSGTRIVQTLGRHPNDRMLSFYAKTPSGFDFEFGWGGREVDDATWTPTTYNRISDWGHHPPAVIAKNPAKPREAKP